MQDTFLCFRGEVATNRKQRGLRVHEFLLTRRLGMKHGMCSKYKMIQRESPVILVLEDEILLVVDIEFNLTEAGFEPVAFSRCATAEEWLKGHTPAAAIIDIRLPDGSCSRIANMLQERKIPFLIHTGSDEAQVDDFDPSRFFTKPSDPDLVMNALRTIIDEEPGVSGQSPYVTFH